MLEEDEVEEVEEESEMEEVEEENEVEEVDEENEAEQKAVGDWQHRHSPLTHSAQNRLRCSTIHIVQ